MARTLYLMRHASAVDHHPEGDFARGLTPKGKAEANAVGQQLAGAGIQLVLCSAAERARQTVEALHLPPINGEPVAVQYMKALYNSDTQTILNRIGEIEDEVSTLLVVAHAPAIPGLSAQLAWQSNQAAADALECHFPTAGYSSYRVEESWAEFAANEGAGAQLDGLDGLGIPTKPSC